MNLFRVRLVPVNPDLIRRDDFTTRFVVADSLSKALENPEAQSRGHVVEKVERLYEVAP